MSAPVITSITPKSGPAGTIITITGTFLAQVKQVQVGANGDENVIGVAPLAGQTDTQLLFAVPVGLTGEEDIALIYPGVFETPNAFNETPPPPALKAPIRGLIDRGKVPSLSFIKAYVIDAPMSAFWDGTKLLHPNPLDNANSAYSWKLRTGSAGQALQSMKTLAGFTPVAVTDPADSTSVTVGPFWREDYMNMWGEFMLALADYYDANGSLREVVMAEQGLVYDEPFRQYGNPGYTLSGFEQTFGTMYELSKVWKTTLLDLAFNPFTPQDPAFTAAQITAVRSALGKQVVLGNNSIRDSYLADPGPMYPEILAAGGPIYYQTAGLAKMGDFATTMQFAQKYGAGSVELPTYSSIPVALLEQWQAALSS